MITRKYLKLYLLPLLCMAVAVDVVHAREGDVYTLLDDSNLRQGPDTFYAPTSSAAKGAQAIELNNSGDWKKVRLFSSGDVGWVYADSLSLSSANSEAPKVLDHSSTEVSNVESQATVINNDPKSLSGNKPGSSAQFEAGQVGVPRSVDTSQANTMEMLELKPKPVVQNMTPSKDGVDGEFVSPMFEDGAVSQEAIAPSVAQNSRPDVEARKKVSAVSASSTKARSELLQTAADENMLSPRSGKLALQQFPVQLASSRSADEPGQAVNRPVPREIPPSLLAEKSSEMIDSKKDGKLNVYLPVQKNDISQNINEKTKGTGDEPEAKALGRSQLVMQTAMIRVGPSALSEVLGWAGAGAQVQTMQQLGKWMKVRLFDSGRIGWVEAAALDGTNVHGLSALSETKANDIAETGTPVMMVKQQINVEEAASLEHRGRQATPQWETTHDLGAPLALKPEKSVYKFNRKATLRAGPNATFDSVSWAGKGSQATELNRKGSWVRIQMQVSKRIGWVYDKSLELISAGAGLAAGSVAPVFNVKLQSGNSQSDKAQFKPRPIEAAKSTASKSEFGSINNLYNFKGKSTLRAGPAQKYDAVSWAGKGSYALGQDRKGNWVRVQMQVSKRIGWVHSSSLNVVKAGAIAPAAIVVKADKAVTQAGENIDGSDHKLHFFKRTSNLRAGPGKEFERIAWGGRNESAEQIEHKGDWKRVRMTISGKTGWVFKDYLVQAVHAGYIMGVTRSVLAPSVKSTGKSGQMYQVVRTLPLRADAGENAELTGTVQKGDLVAWLEERSGWVRVNPQVDGGKIGWLEARFLKKRKLFKAEHTQALINHENVLTYKNRISKGETFNFSYAALEEALYNIPVEEIHIRIREDDLKAVFLKRQFDQSPFDIRLTTGRHRLSGTLKVLGSSTRIFKKKSIMIKLDKESTRWYGHRRMALRSMASDKALMREWMAWKMMAALGMKVPEVHFARVSFNKGEKTALYLSIEWMGSEFLEGNNLDAHGEFYQPNDAAHCGDLYSPENVELCFDKITPFGDFSNLKSMARSVNEATSENIHQVLAKYFEDESIINWIAVNALVTNGDTYNKNYWLYYHPTKEKWTVVPWDYNLTFGRTYDHYSTKKFRIFNDNFQYYYPPDVGAGNPIKDKALRNPMLRKRLEEKIKHLIGMEPNGSEQTFGWFSPTVMRARIGNLGAVVGKEVYKDTFLSYGEGDFTKTYESLMHYVTSHDYFLKTKLFGDYPWKPEPPNQPETFMPLPNLLYAKGNIDAGAESLHMVDRGWGYFVAGLNLNEPLKRKAEFEVKIEGGMTPKLLPTVVQSASRCIERSWLLKTFTENVSVTGDLMIEYTQENSRRSEVPPSIHEALLELWMLDGNRWKPIQTEVNEYSNTLIAKNVHVESGHQYRFVACSPF